MKSLLTNCFFAFLLAIQLISCSPFSSFQKAEVSPKDSLIVGAGVLVPVLLHQWKSPTDTNNSIPVVGAEVRARYGLTNYLDVGIKSTNGLSLLFDAKLQYLNTKYFDAAADFAFSWEPFPGLFSDNNPFFFSLDPNLLFSVNFCKSYTLTFCYKQIYQFWDSTGLLYHAVTITSHIGNNYKIIPEIGLLWDKERICLMQFAVGMDIPPLIIRKSVK